ncbi:hypothetical protein F2Q69_00015034 [Brassica cretica]|uniref:Protein kinase domain-containing protein n=1 Tax=Brassica cretica TaxID=69181 RepID=A0A8S9QWZ1_BRACR|nr:hypothetical protein F2Q69_00015034 [Brassica cretica]
MEVAPHGSLKDMLTKAGGTLPENVIGYCIFQVLEGLRDLHQHGYVHCDLKPENILIFPSYAHEDLCELKLGDFGSAKEPNGPDPVDGFLFEDNPGYLAPEAVGPRGVISSAVDIWSLGTMVIEMMGITISGWSDYVPGTLSQMTWDRATAEELMSHEFVRQSLGAPPLELLPVPSCLTRVHPISPSPKALLILDELSLSSIRSQLTSWTATARVPDQTRSVPARASARVRSSSFQLAFQLFPARVPPARGSLGGPVLQSSKPKGNSNSENMNRIWLFCKD